VFDLRAYLQRIDYRDEPRADLATLVAIHRAHTEAIVFENLDIQLGLGVSLNAEALQDKIVTRRRGGYCFEQNTLFALALAAVGFAPRTLEARVRQGSKGSLRPRTHMVLVVPCAGREWLADVGFGGDGLVEPIALDGEIFEQAGCAYRLVAEGPVRVLQRATGDDWEDLYAILPDAVHPIDLEVANWYTSTHPQSAFVLNLTAQRCIGDRRHILRNLTYTISGHGWEETRAVARDELLQLLRDVFALELPADARLRALDDAPSSGPPRDPSAPSTFVS
jgi:N-hydroxyarylamine O-acetyltransferase